jgi:hypothetical protein
VIEDDDERMLQTNEEFYAQRRAAWDTVCAHEEIRAEHLFLTPAERAEDKIIRSEFA